MNPPQVCDYCKENKVYAQGNILICTECEKGEKMLTKTQAMDKYSLNANDLKNIPHLIKRNKVNSARPMTVYFEEDIEEKAIEKHGSEEKLKEAQKKRSAKKEKLQETKDERREELEKFLKSKGIDKIESGQTIKYYEHKKDHEVDRWLNIEPYIKNGPSSGLTKEKIYDILTVRDFYINHTKYNEFYKERKSKGCYGLDTHIQVTIVTHKKVQKEALETFIDDNKDKDAREWVDLIPPSLRDNEKLQSVLNTTLPA